MAASKSPSQHNDDDVKITEELMNKFKEFCKITGSKDHTHMTPNASGKMVDDCFPELKKYDAKAVCDASVFPACKEKGKPYMIVNEISVRKFVNKFAHEIAKRKTKKSKIDPEDIQVKELKINICNSIEHGDPHVHKVKASATGNVKGLTDTSKYTGSSKERFDKDGKGKGKEGREVQVSDTGYVSGYKDKGTYDTNH